MHGDAACYWRVDGLPPGNYKVDLTYEGSAAARTAIAQVRVQRVTNVQMLPPLVRLSGRLAVNGSVVPGAAIDVVSRQSAFQATIVTDTSGGFELSLPQAGEYDLAIRESEIPWAVKRIAVKEGDNRVNWELMGAGTLTVQLRGAVEAVRVRIESRQMGSNDLLPFGETSVTKGGLPFGTYDVSASDSSGLVSGVRTVRLEPKSASATVELELTSNDSSMVVSDGQGRPVEGAVVRPMRGGDLMIGAGPALRQQSPGLYELRGMTPGVRLVIRAEGFVPTCRVVPLNARVSAVLEPAGPRILCYRLNCRQLRLQSQRWPIFRELTAQCRCQSLV